MLRKNGLSMLQNSSIFKMYNSSVRSGFKVKINYSTVFIMAGTKIVTHCLFLNTQIPGNFCNAAVRKRMLDAAQFVKCNIHITDCLVNKTAVWEALNFTSKVQA